MAATFRASRIQEPLELCVPSLALSPVPVLFATVSLELYLGLSGVEEVVLKIKGLG